MNHLESINVAEWLRSKDFPFQIIKASLNRVYSDVYVKISDRKNPSQANSFECGCWMEIAIKDDSIKWKSIRYDWENILTNKISAWAKPHIPSHLCTDFDGPEFRNYDCSDVDYNIDHQEHWIDGQGLFICNFFSEKLESIVQQLNIVPNVPERKGFEFL